jgi:hypothetical protein
MRIDKRKGLNEVTQQGSYSSQHDVFFTPLSGYIMRVLQNSQCTVAISI